MKKMTRGEKTEYLLSEIKRIMEENGGIAKTNQITALGVDYRRILAWVEDGTLERVKNGYYSMGYQERSEEELIRGLFSDGVLCLDSALYYYHYIDQKPYAWHLAVDKNTSKSRFKMEYPVIVPYYTEPKTLKLGVTEIPFAGGSMKIYTKERMLCDCLKYEEKLERDVFKRALLAYIADSSKDIAKLLQIARERKVLQKVQNVIGVWL